MVTNLRKSFKMLVLSILKVSFVLMFKESSFMILMDLY